MNRKQTQTNPIKADDLRLSSPHALEPVLSEVERTENQKNLKNKPNAEGTPQVDQNRQH